MFSNYDIFTEFLTQNETLFAMISLASAIGVSVWAKTSFFWSYRDKYSSQNNSRQMINHYTENKLSDKERENWKRIKDEAKLKRENTFFKWKQQGLMMQYEKELQLLNLLMDDIEKEKGSSDHNNHNNSNDKNRKELTLSQVQQAFRQKMFELHPDFNQGASKERLIQLSEERCRVIQAYQVVRKVSQSVQDATSKYN